MTMKKLRLLLSFFLLCVGVNMAHSETIWFGSVRYFYYPSTDLYFDYNTVSNIAELEIMDFAITNYVSIEDDATITINNHPYTIKHKGFNAYTKIETPAGSLLRLTISSKSSACSFNHADFTACTNFKSIYFSNKVWVWGNAQFYDPNIMTVTADTYDENLKTWQGNVKCATTNPNLTENNIGYYKDNDNNVYLCKLGGYATSVVIPATVGENNISYFGAPDVDITSPTSIKNLTFESNIQPLGSFKQMTNLENITFNGISSYDLKGKLTDNANLKTITFHGQLPQYMSGSATNYVAHPENVTILIDRNMGVTPAQLHFDAFWSAFKDIAYYDEWTGDKTEITISSTPSNMPVELWQGNNKLGSIPTRGGYLTTHLEDTENLVLRVPSQYLESIMSRGYDISTVMPSSTSTDSGYENYTYYTLSSQYLQGTTPNIQINFSDDCLQNLQTDAFRVQMSGAGTVHGVIKFADYSAYDGDRYSFDLDGGNTSVWNFVFSNPGTYGARRVREVEWLEVTVTPEIDNPSAIVFEAGRSPFTMQDNGDGSYTYTITGYNLTSNWVNINMPATDFGDVKTVISSRNGKTLGYYFGEYIIIDSRFHQDYNQSKGAFVNTDETVMHFGNWVLAEWGTLSTGIIYIQVPKAAQGEPLPFRLIENGEIKTAMCYWHNAGEHFTELLEIDSYLQYECPVDGYYYLLQDVQNDSYIIVDDGTIQLDQVASPFQLAQSLTVHGDATLTLRKSNGQIVKSVSDGKSENISWEKGESMQISATLPENTSAANYEVHLIIDGADNILGIVTGEGGVISLATFEMGSINTAHNIVLITRQVDGFEAPDIIEFADAEVKRICVANWDTDGDGELSKAEAAAVTSLLVPNSSGEDRSVFRYNATIASFDELEYFTGLTELGTGSFQNCTSLSSIHLPSTIKTLGQVCFDGCSSLKEIHLPEGLTSLVGWTFGHTGLRTIYIPKNVSSIGACSFGSCADLTSIVVDPDNRFFKSPDACNGIIRYDNTLVVGTRYTRIPEGVRTIGNTSYAFDTQIKSVEIPSTVTNLELQTFYGCSNLTSVVSKAKTPPTFNATYSFYNISANCVLTVPYGCADAYASWAPYFKGGIVEDKSQFDTNGDSNVSIADVTTLVNVILGKPIQ